MSVTLSIIIPTKDRAPVIGDLLASLAALEDLERIAPEIIFGDNQSGDDTAKILKDAAGRFPIPIRVLQVRRPGKSAVMNEASRVATGDVLAFLDDDVIVDRYWLVAIERFFARAKWQVGQGVIRYREPEASDPEIRKLIQRYETIPHLEYGPSVDHLRSLNGANMAIRRETLARIGCFDERLGPGASGTSEDVDLALRLNRAGIAIGYMRDALVYHRVDRERLTESYFKAIHKRQGTSRLVLKNHATGRIVFNLGRAALLFGVYTLAMRERKKYRSKGRVYHYLAMLEAKWQQRKG